VFITTTGPAVYKLQWAQNNSGTASLFNGTGINTGASKVTWRKISGLIPTSGSTVDFLYMPAIAGQSVSAAGPLGVKVDFTTANLTVASGNITADPTADTFTLLAGKTYQLEAELRYDLIANQEVSAQWYNETGSVMLGIGGYYRSNSLLNRDAPIVKAVVTPSANMTVSLRTWVAAGGGTASLQSNIGSFILIKQIGTTATTTRSLSSMMATNATAFSVANTGATIAVNTGWTTTHDITGAFNATTGVFTCPKAARYQVNFNYTYNSSVWAASNIYRAHILKNGATVAQSIQGIHAAVTSIVGIGVSHVIDCAAGDLITVGASNNRATGATIFTAAGAENVWSIAELPSAL
jgi:hypothetical protein